MKGRKKETNIANVLQNKLHKKKCLLQRRFTYQSKNVKIYQRYWRLHVNKFGHTEQIGSKHYQTFSIFICFKK